MGIKERQERERELVRQAILDAARALFITEGYSQVSIRKIAERIEYSPAAIYSYFAGKDDIFLALAEEGFRLMAEMGAVVPEVGSPLETLRGRLMAVYHFSVAHPEHFALMLFDRSVPRIIKYREQLSLLIEMRQRMADTVRQCIQAGDLPEGLDALSVVRLLFTAMNGAAAARLFNRLTPGEDGEALARDLIDLVLAGLRTGGALRFQGMPLGYLAAADDSPGAAAGRGEGSSPPAPAAPSH